MPDPTKVALRTDDGVTIIGECTEAARGRWALLLHMMPATKESWRPFAAKLAEKGFSTLAIDFRGHGESIESEGGRLDYKEFSDQEHQAKIKDVEAAARWLVGRGASLERLLVAGASIGANLAVVFAALHHEVPAVIALSPGLNYRGVKIEAALASYVTRQKVLLAASEEDEYAFLSVRTLAAARPQTDLKTLQDAGHGTAMMEHDAEFASQLVDWVDEAVGEPPERGMR